MRDYELTIVFRSELDDEARGALLDRVLEWAKVGGEEGSEPTVTSWGERKLAYEIDDQATGFYVLVEATMDPAQIAELERNMRFVDGILRHLVVRAEPLKSYEFDYKNANVLRDYVTDHGHIVPRRRNRISAKQQRSLATAIKRARHLALMPFVVD